MLLMHEHMAQGGKGIGAKAEAWVGEGRGLLRNWRGLTPNLVLDMVLR